MMDTSRSKFTEGRWVSLKTVMLMRMLCGFYCNLSSNRILSILARLYCICLANVVTAVFFFGCLKHEFDFLFFLPFIFEYNFNVLVSIITGDNHLVNYYTEIERIDREMGLEHQPLLTFKCKVLLLLLCAYKIVYNAWIYVAFGEKSLVFWPSLFMAVAISIGGVSRCFPLDILRLRMKHLWYGLETELKRENWNQNNKINSVIESLKLFRHFMNNLMIMPWEKFLICVNFASSFFFVLLNCRHKILDLQNLQNEASFEFTEIFLVLDLLCICIVTCLPALLIEMVAKEAETLKLVIANALLIEEDDELRALLEGAADYLVLRPFRVTVYRAFALDASLILTFLSFCTTYTIVMIQYVDIL